METKNKEYYSIDIMHIVKSVWRRIWIVAVSGILTALVGLILSAFIITPTYESSVQLYVNNQSTSQGATDTGISSSQITAAQELAKTYRVILKNRQTLEEVIEKTGVPYNYKELSDMIDAAPADDTEIINVTVVSDDPAEAALIANGIKDVLPARVEEIVKGASMTAVGPAYGGEKIGPSMVKFTFIGLILGVLASCVVLVVLALMDVTIHDEDYVIKNYDCPILAKVPDLVSGGDSKRYGYYYKTKRDSESND